MSGLFAEFRPNFGGGNYYETIFRNVYTRASENIPA
jgi:hypothetical protein